MSNHIQVTLKYRQQAQEIRNVFYFSGGGVDSNQQNIVDYLRLSWVTYLRPQLVNDIEIYAADVRDVGVAGLPVVEYTFTAGTSSGQITTPGMPLQVAGLVVFGANVARPNKTRKFIAGIPASHIADSGHFSPTMVSALEDWADDVLDITTTYTGVALSAVQWAGDGSYVTGSNLMTFRTVNSNPSTQRRRRLGVGI